MATTIDWEKREAERKAAEEITNASNLVEALKLWKKLKLKSATMTFSCGGDSMNDTSFSFEDKYGDVASNELDSYFQDAVYNYVRFYEDSDGVYQGEAGTVEITLNDEKDGFNYVKNAKAEYTENHTESTFIELPTPMIKFIKKNVFNMNGSYDDKMAISFNKDFIMTDEQEVLLAEIETLLQEKIKDYCPQELDVIWDDWFTFTTSEDKKLTVKGNSLEMEITKSYTRYEPSED